MESPTEVLVTTWVNHPTSALLEWVAHHRAIGATRIHVFYPEKENEVPELIDALCCEGVIEASAIVSDASESAEQIRNTAIRAAELEASGKGGWGIFLGPDEYAVLAKHKTLGDLLSDLKGVHALTAPVRVFAPGDKREHEPGPVLEMATHCLPDPAADGSGGREWRSVVKQGLWNARLPGYPTGKIKTDLSRVRWVNGAGKPMPKPWSDWAWQRDESSFGDDLISVARVSAPSVETMLLRAAYAHPVKSQPMAEDLVPLLDAAKGALIKDNTLQKNAKIRQLELAKLMKITAVAEAQERQCHEETRRAQKQRNRHQVWGAVLGYLDGKPLPTEADDITLTPDAGLTPSQPTPQPQPKPAAAPPKPEAPVVKPTKHKSKIRDLDPTPVKAHPRVPDAFARVATDPPPQWFAEIYPGGDGQGFMTRLEHHALIHIQRDPDTLIVSFDNISNVYDISYGREPWGYKFVQSGGYSHLAVIARRKDWYRDPEVIKHLEGLANQGFFAKFKKVVMTGTSMGGFAALAFSSLSPGCTVLAYSPQTTLDVELVPWEDRFGMGRDRNWSLPFSDAAFEVQDAKRVFVVYDPFFEPDRKHIERLEGDNVTYLKSWFAGHFTAVFIRRAHLIKPLFKSVIDETLTEQSYYELLRGRRELQWYRKALEERAIEHGHPKLAEMIGPAFRRNLRMQEQEA